MNFQTVEQALKWAYEMRTRPAVAMSPLSGVRAVSPDGTGDRHIMTAVSILNRATMAVDYYEKAFLNFMFGYDDLALPALVQHFEGLGVPARSRALELILRSYRGDKKACGLRDLRKVMQVGMLRTVSVRNHAYDYLDIMYSKIIDHLKDPLKDYLS